MSSVNERSTEVDRLKERISNGEVLLGTWVKTPSTAICEVLAKTDLDFVCLDAEHAPFTRQDLDCCLGMLSALEFPALVRVPSSAPEQSLNALDCGATGVVIPHVTSGETAAVVARQSHFGRRGRGFAGATRAAGYTSVPMAEHLDISAARTVVFAQIEDVEAVDDIDAIAEVEGIDCLFIGRADLTVALGAESPKSSEVVQAVRKVCDAGRKASRPVGMFLSDLTELPEWQALGATVFILSSDHGAMLSGIRSLVGDFDKHTGRCSEGQIP